MPKQEDIFAGAVVIGAVAVSPGTAKVVQKLADGRVSIGTFFVKDGLGKPRSGGLIMSEECFASLAAQAKVGQPVDLSALEMPKADPSKRSGSSTTAKIDALAEQVAQLAALLANSMTANGKVKVTS